MATRKFICYDNGIIKTLTSGDSVDLQNARIINIPTPTDAAHIANRNYCLGITPEPAGSYVIARYSCTYNQSLTAGVTPIDFSGLITDTDSAVTTGSAWKFTCPADKGGWYRIVAQIYNNSGLGWMSIYKNNNKYKYLLYIDTAYFLYNGICMIELAAGDYIDIRSDVNVTTVGDSNADKIITIVSLDRY